MCAHYCQTCCRCSPKERLRSGPIRIHPATHSRSRDADVCRCERGDRRRHCGWLGGKAQDAAPSCPGAVRRHYSVEVPRVRRQASQRKAYRLIAATGEGLRRRRSSIAEIAIRAHLKERLCGRSIWVDCAVHRRRGGSHARGRRGACRRRRSNWLGGKAQDAAPSCPGAVRRHYSVEVPRVRRQASQRKAYRLIGESASDGLWVG